MEGGFRPSAESTKNPVEQSQRGKEIYILLKKLIVQRDEWV
jgi:hypothetical protein